MCAYSKFLLSGFYFTIFVTKLIHFMSCHNGVAVFDEDNTCLDANTAQNEREHQRHQCHIAEIDGPLEYTTHWRFIAVVIEGINVANDARHASVKVC